MDRRRVVTIAALILLAGAGIVAAVSVSRRDREPVAAATAVLEEEARFDTSRRAVESFAAVYQHLVEATRRFPKDCDVAAGRGRCLALNQAASWSLNVATASGSCTQPAIQEARLALLDYLGQTVALDDRAADPPPLPSIPRC